tara:strand:- start:342 stop:1469 length:1128 start_codon:yes stop_codon:yes gene_type:complete
MNIISSFSGYLYFLKKIRLAKKKSIIFYSESKNYRNYFINLINILSKNDHITVIYLTSDQNDMDLIEQNIKPIFIGSGFFRLLLFVFLKCDMLIMTLTDLGNHEIKKSKNCKNYLYVFHSLVSTHKTYTHNAFKNFDIILTNGEYQKNELEYCEELYNLPKKKIINTGYMYLEKLKREKKDNTNSKRILFAPSWNKLHKNLFNDHSNEIIDRLIDEKFIVTLRTHPELIKRSNKKINFLKKKYENNKNFELNTDISDLEILNNSFILITDNGGMALEYILVQKKPVLFIDYADKVHNNFYEKVKLDALEDKFKKRFGFTIQIDNLKNIDLKIQEALVIFEKNKNHINSFAYDNGVILENQTLNAQKTILDLLNCN